MIIMAIDPGREGGIAFYDTRAGDFTHIMALPYDGDMVNVAEVQGEIIEYKPAEMWIEEQQARNGQAHQAVIMQNYGRLTAVADLCGVKWDEIRPQVWQKALHGKPTSDKGETITHLEGEGHLVPKRTPRSRKPDSGMADAMAIAIVVASKGWAGTIR